MGCVKSRLGLAREQHGLSEPALLPASPESPAGTGQGLALLPIRSRPPTDWVLYVGAGVVAVDLVLWTNAPTTAGVGPWMWIGASLLAILGPLCVWRVWAQGFPLTEDTLTVRELFTAVKLPTDDINHFEAVRPVTGQGPVRSRVELAIRTRDDLRVPVLRYGPMPPRCLDGLPGLLDLIEMCNEALEVPEDPTGLPAARIGPLPEGHHLSVPLEIPARYHCPAWSFGANAITISYNWTQVTIPWTVVAEIADGYASDSHHELQWVTAIGLSHQDSEEVRWIGCATGWEHLEPLVTLADRAHVPHNVSGIPDLNDFLVTESFEPGEWRRSVL